MAKVFKSFEVQPNGQTMLVLRTDGKEPKVVEGIDFTNVPEETRQFFIKREKRQLDTYLLKNKIGNFSIHIASKHSKFYEELVKTEIAFWASHGVHLL